MPKLSRPIITTKPFFKRSFSYALASFLFLIISLISPLLGYLIEPPICAGSFCENRVPVFYGIGRGLVMPMLFIGLIITAILEIISIYLAFKGFRKKEQGRHKTLTLS